MMWRRNSITIKKKLKKNKTPVAKTPNPPKFVKVIKDVRRKSLNVYGNNRRSLASQDNTISSQDEINISSQDEINISSQDEINISVNSPYVDAAVDQINVDSGEAPVDELTGNLRRGEISSDDGLLDGSSKTNQNSAESQKEPQESSQSSQKDNENIAIQSSQEGTKSTKSKKKKASVTPTDEIDEFVPLTPDEFALPSKATTKDPLKVSKQKTMASTTINDSEEQIEKGIYTQKTLSQELSKNDKNQPQAISESESDSEYESNLPPSSQKPTSNDKNKDETLETTESTKSQPPKKSNLISEKSDATSKQGAKDLNKKQITVSETETEINKANNNVSRRETVVLNKKTTTTTTTTTISSIEESDGEEEIEDTEPEKTKTSKASNTSHATSTISKKGKATSKESSNDKAKVTETEVELIPKKKTTTKKAITTKDNSENITKQINDDKDSKQNTETTSTKRTKATSNKQKKEATELKEARNEKLKTPTEEDDMEIEETKKKNKSVEEKHSEKLQESKKVKGGRTSARFKSSRMSKSERAGIQFPVSRVKRYLRDCKNTGRIKMRITATSAVYLAAVLEYMSAEVLEISGKYAIEGSRRRITPRHILLAIRNDEELAKLLRDVVIPNSGVRPNIMPELYPKLTKKSSDVTVEESQTV